jgi:hypothetical protein
MVPVLDELRFLALDGPLNGSLNGLYVSLAEAYEVGYEAPDKDTAVAWNFEPVVIWRSSR